MTTIESLRSPRPREPLPSARIARWQPLRGGLVDIFKYENQEFRYEGGRLILRGNNGTGKSRVLALQFPFLFDGETAPHRLEPDGDPAKRIEWNLLMGRYPERTGYTWAELGRRDADGTERYVTIGCGLRAVDGRGIADRWFFVTPQRIGRDLSLLTAERVVLGRERLSEAIAPEGRVFRDAKSYRAEVNRLFFGLDQRRYEALVDLLIQLRKPQLSRSLDEGGLSAALSEALSPASVDVIGPVAEAFRGLEEERASLEHYTAADRSVRAFMREYRRYAAIASRRAAAGVRQANYQCEMRTREQRAAEEGLAEAKIRLQDARAEVERVERERGIARAELSTLETSPEKRRADDLDHARTRASELASAARGAETRRARALAERICAEGELSGATAFEGAARGEVEGKLVAAARDAGAAGLAALHATVLGPLGLLDTPEASRAFEAAHRRMIREIDGRRAALRVLKEHQAAARAALSDVAQARALLTDAQEELSEAIERDADAREAQARAGEALIAAFRAWCARLGEMEIPGEEAVRDALEAWCAAPEGRSPVEAAAADGHDAAKRRLYEGRAGLRREGEDLATRLGDLRAQRDQLAAGHHAPPPPPPTRDVAARAAREGAPLWRLCEFRSELTPAARAGIEAALEAAGLLDAWVTPDGRLLAEGVHDAVIVAGTSPAPGLGRDLGGWLVPSFDEADPGLAAMREETVAAVLRHVGAGAGTGTVWVALDGRFQIGPLHGRWAKAEATHIGHVAREVARRRRLDEIASEIARAEAESSRIERDIEVLAGRERRLDRERQTTPDGKAVLDAHSRAEAARGAVVRGESKVARQREHEQLRRAELDAACAKRDAVARDLGVADPSMDLDTLVEALGNYSRALERLGVAAQALVAAARSAVTARSRHDATVEGAAQAADEASAAREQAAEAAVVRDTLQATIGAAVEDVLRRLDEARLRVRGLEREHRPASDERERAAVAEGVARDKIARACEAQAEAFERRKTVTDEFVRFVAMGFGAIAADALAEIGPGDWSVTRAVDVARHFDTELESTAADDGAWERSEKGIHRHIEELKRTLGPYDHEVGVVTERGLSIVTALFGGKECTMRAFERALEHEVESRRALLTAREREVIENHLSAEIALHLHKLIREAEAWVGRVNAELDARPTSTGMRLRFAWEPLEDEVPGLAAARRRLLRTDGTWTPAERSALGEFLQQRIQLERQRRESGTWQEHLTTALDYRKWHRFVVERYQDKVWKPLTKKTHGTGSSGEKAIALTVPQFAAAAAHYSSAWPTAPRLILLDEAFVGIDKPMRGHCMALLSAFDLDFIMTSESEWGCYPTVPALAICQLATRPEVDAVGVTRWVWNGRERVRADAVAS